MSNLIVNSTSKAIIHNFRQKSIGIWLLHRIKHICQHLLRCIQLTWTFPRPKNSPPDTFYTSLQTGTAFPVRASARKSRVLSHSAFSVSLEHLRYCTLYTTATIVTHSPHPYRMRSVYHRTFPRAKKCPPDTFYTSLRTGAALSSPCICQKKPSAFALGFFWQGHKDLNPEPTVLETAALPIELYPYIYKRQKALRNLVGLQGLEPGTIRL